MSASVSVAAVEITGCWEQGQAAALAEDAGWAGQRAAGVERADGLEQFLGVRAAVPWSWFAVRNEGAQSCGSLPVSVGQLGG